MQPVFKPEDFQKLSQANIDSAVKARHVVRDALPQRRQSEVVRIEGLAGLNRIYRRLTDDVWGDFITLTEPECQHIVAPHAGCAALAFSIAARTSAFEASATWACTSPVIG